MSERINKNLRAAKDLVEFVGNGSYGYLPQLIRLTVSAIQEYPTFEKYGNLMIRIPIEFIDEKGLTSNRHVTVNKIKEGIACLENYEIAKENPDMDIPYMDPTYIAYYSYILELAAISLKKIIAEADNYEHEHSK